MFIFCLLIMATLPKKVFRLKAKELRKQVTTLGDTGFVEDLRADDQSGGLIPGMGSLTDGPELLVDIIDGIINGITGLVDPYAAIEQATQEFATNPIPVSETISSGDTGGTTINVTPVLSGLNDILKQTANRTALSSDQVLKGFLDQDPKLYETLTQFATRDRLDYLRSEYIAAISVSNGDTSVNYTGDNVQNVKGSLSLLSELSNNKFVYELNDIASLRTLLGNVSKNSSLFSTVNAASLSMEKAFSTPGFNYKALFYDIMKNAVNTSDTGLMLEMAIYLNQRDEGPDYTRGKYLKTTKTVSKRALLSTMYTYMGVFFSKYRYNTDIKFMETIVEYIRIDAIMRLCRPVPDEINTNISIRQDYPSSPVSLQTTAFYPLGCAFRIAAEVKTDAQASNYLSLLNSNDPLPSTGMSGIEQSRRSFLEFVGENKLNMGDWRFLYKKSLFPNVSNWIDLMDAAYRRGLRVGGETFVFDWKAYQDEYYDAIAGDWKTSAISKQYRAMIGSAVTKLTVADLVSSALVEGPFYSHEYFLEKRVVSDIYKNITNKGILQIFANYAEFSKNQKNIINMDVSDTIQRVEMDDILVNAKSSLLNANNPEFLNAIGATFNNILKAYPFVENLTYKPVFTQYGGFYYVDVNGKIVDISTYTVI